MVNWRLKYHQIKNVNTNCVNMFVMHSVRKNILYCGKAKRHLISEKLFIRQKTSKPCVNGILEADTLQGTNIHDKVVTRDRNTPLGFNVTNGEIIFQTKKMAELFRGLVVLTLSSNDWFVRNCLTLMLVGRRLVGGTMFDAIMKRTFFGQFAVEEAHHAVKSLVDRFEEAAIGSIICKTAEEDVGEDPGSFDEERYDRNVQSMLQSLYLQYELSAKCRPAVIQLKVTSYMKADVLAKLSEVLESESHNLVNRTKVNLENFMNGLNGKMTEIPDLNPKDMLHVQRSLLRINKIAEESVALGIHLLVDAERVNINPTLSLIAIAMMKKFNSSKAYIFNTYQSYLKRAYERIAEDSALADEQGFCFGVKLVRGAYMHAEKEAARVTGKEDPINPSFEDTNNMYDRNMEFLFNRISKNDEKECRTIVASHNISSVQKAIILMDELNISPTSGKVIFGQLYGMCDHVSFALGQSGYQVYKSIVVGTVEEVLMYLSRRAQENNTVFHRMHEERSLLKCEIKRRIRGII